MKRMHSRGAILVALECLFLGLASWAYVVLTPTAQTRLVKPPVPKDVITHTTLTPSEKPVQAATYVSPAGPTQPKFISLPTINASGFIQNMGIDQNNAIASPNNVTFAGWYIYSVSPGQPGLSIIDGHIDGLHGPGIFYHLVQLKTGDQFTVELGDNTVHTFTVVSVTNVNNQDADAALFARDTSIASQLNIITCGGDFNWQTHSYEQRTIVVSRLSN